MPRLNTAKVAAILTIALSSFGLVAWILTEPIGRPVPATSNIFYHLYHHNELYPLLLSAAFSLALFGSASSVVTDASSPPPIDISSQRIGSLCTVLVALICAAGWQLVFHGYSLSMDEFNADFQAQIFRRGDAFAPLQAEFEQHVSALKPVFVRWQPATHGWIGGYLPGYALLRALVEFVTSAGWLTNALLTAGSVVLVERIARTLWPRESAAPVIAVLAIASSSQLLVTGMTAYAMPAHLFFNLWWLSLFLRRDSIGYWGTPLVGAFALGLHNPFPHALFVAPFLLRMLYEREWRRLAWWVPVYIVASCGWLAWMRLLLPAKHQGNLLFVFDIPGPGQLFLQVVNAALFTAWQAPIVIPLVISAMLGWRHLDGTARDLALGILGTLCFYSLMPSTQGHGWGYRYLHGMLGSVALLSAYGLPRISSSLVPRARVPMLVLGFAALLVQLPVRTAQISAYVRPWAQTAAHLESIDAAAVIVESDSVYYGQDLIRNNPYLDNRPLILASSSLTSGDSATIVETIGGPVLRVGARELAEFGLHRFEASAVSRRFIRDAAPDTLR